MFIHSQRLKARIFAVLLLVPTAFLGWVLFKIFPGPPFQRVQLTGWFFVGFLALTIAILFWGCIILWRAGNLSGKALPDPKQWTGPNSIKPSTRIQHGLASCALLAYAVYAVWIDDFFIPAKGGGGIHLHGLSAWLMFGAVCCAVVNLVSVVIDHYDRRNNELSYAHVAAATQWLGWTFFLAALVKDFVD